MAAVAPKPQEQPSTASAIEYDAKLADHRTGSESPQPILVTARELNQDTSGVLRRLMESGDPALVTLRGRFVAVITPIEPGTVEQAALQAAIRSRRAEKGPGEFSEDHVLESFFGDDARERSVITVAEAAARLGLDPAEFQDE